MTDEELPIHELRATEETTVRRRLVAGVSGVAVIGVAAAVIAGVAVTSHGAATSAASRPGAGGGQLPAAQPVASTNPIASVTLVRDSNYPGTRTWIPANRAATWELSRPDLPGASHAQRADCAAFPFFQTAPPVVAPGGTTAVGTPAYAPNCDQGSWAFYRPKFAASLPDDPAAVLASMRKASYQGRDMDTFTTGFDFISSGWAEPATVGKVVAAMKLIPGVTVTPNVANSDGVTGEAITRSGDLKPGVTEYFTLIVNPDTDQVIGTRYHYSNKPVDSTSISYTKVDHLGDTK